MPTECVVNVDDIQTVSMANIRSRITALSPERMDEVAVAIAYALDLPFGY